MAQTSLIIGDTNWAVKEDSLLGYNVIQNKYLPIPIDTARATTATRVNEQGLIEIVPRNLLTYSQDYSNANWIKSNSPTMTYNSAIAPNGTMTASGTKSDNALNYKSINQTISSISPNSTFTYSIYVKKETSETFFGGLSLYFSGGTPKVFYGIVNAVNGTVTIASSSITPTIQIISEGNYWRIIATATDTGSNTSVLAEYYATFSQNGTSLATGIGSVRTIWGAQLEQGSVATEYFPTTNRLDIPRVDYSTGSAALLVEPQRTNFFLRSEEFNDANWVKINADVTANNTISPSGVLNADKLIATAVSGLHIALQITTGSINGTTSTASVFVKAAGLSNITLLNNQGGGGIVDYNLLTGAVTLVSGVSASIQNYGNGWYRCIMTFVPNTTGNFNIQVRLADSSGNTTFTGNGVDGVFLWGFQVEAGAYPTSYIPTVASTVTRNADVLSRTGISGLIGQDEGTLFCEINLPNPLSNGGKIIVAIGTSPNRIYIAKEGSTTNFFQLATQSSSGFNFINSSVITTPTIKFAIAYKGSNNAFYINGSLISSASAVANPTSFSNLLIGDTSPETNTDIKINSVQLYKTRLTNTELAQLTTL